MKNDTALIQELVFEFFHLCELEPMEIRKGIWQVQIPEALMKELDGWRSQARLLQFTFDQRLAESYGADLICPGSYRLNSILQVTRKQGLYSHAHIPHHFFHEPNIRKKVLDRPGTQRVYMVNNTLQYGQYLELQISVVQQGLQNKERVHTPIVNLSSGDVLKFPIPTHLLRPGGADANLLRKRKTSYKRAFQAALAHLSNLEGNSDLDWALKAQETLYAEHERLETFFEGRTSSPEYAVKRQELTKRLEPLVQMNLLRGAILHIPVFLYRLVLVDPSGREKTQTVVYDPISTLEELD